MIFFLLACDNSFDPSIADGQWQQSNFSIETTDENCDLAGLFVDDLALQYRFDSTASLDDITTDFSPLDMSSYASAALNLHSVCDIYSVPNFSCTIPLFFSHYELWSERFSDNSIHDDGFCTFVGLGGSSNGLFIDENSMQLLSQFEFVCYTTNEIGHVDSEKYCTGRLSSTLNRVD